MRLPLIRPNPPRLSRMTAALEAIERSGTFSNNGPVVRRFEQEMTGRLFGGEGECLAVANATLGLMVAIAEATGGVRGGFALMPAFTFAATAHAALWAGLTPLLCDSEPEGWTASPAEEERLLREGAGQVKVIVPYATFGTCIDLDRYRWLARRFEVGVVIDAAASLGSLGDDGRHFGRGSRFAVVFSMHATKTFATAEGGVIHSVDPARMQALRRMINFGFGEARAALTIGINAKLPEVLALLALAKLGEVEQVCAHRAALAKAYRRALPEFTFQQVIGQRQAMQFMPLLLPPELAPKRDAIIAALATDGIGAAHYFSPHLGQQPYFIGAAEAGPLPAADDIGRRALSLPITDLMTFGEVDVICAALRTACAGAATAAVQPKRRVASGRR